MRLPEAEVSIDTALVCALLREQHPDLAELSLQPVEHGWDNVIYRLGQHLAIRLPRRELGAHCLAHEQTWLPQLAAQLTLPTPTPLRTGEPGQGYPWRWSVVPWLDGEPADLSPADSSQAAPLVEFLRALHVPAPARGTGERHSRRAARATSRGHRRTYSRTRLEPRDPPATRLGICRRERYHLHAYVATRRSACPQRALSGGTYHRRPRLGRCVRRRLRHGSRGRLDLVARGRGSRASDDALPCQCHALGTRPRLGAVFRRVARGNARACDLRYRVMGEHILANVLAGP